MRKQTGSYYMIQNFFITCDIASHKECKLSNVEFNLFNLSSICEPSIFDEITAQTNEISTTNNEIKLYTGCNKIGDIDSGYV